MATPANELRTEFIEWVKSTPDIYEIMYPPEHVVELAAVLDELENDALGLQHITGVSIGEARNAVDHWWKTDENIKRLLSELRKGTLIFTPSASYSASGGEDST